MRTTQINDNATVNNITIEKTDLFLICCFSSDIIGRMSIEILSSYIELLNNKRSEDDRLSLRVSFVEVKNCQ